MSAAGADVSPSLRSGLALSLAQWADSLQPSEPELALADRSLQDTLAVAAAAVGHPYVPLGATLGPAGRLAMLAHLLDYDDLHVPSTTHISAVCVPAALAAGGDARAYLAGAGVMARVGSWLGWGHYAQGWHATCTAGAPAAAVAAGVGLGLDAGRLATALCLAIPAAGGVQAAFGTSAKSLQVGFAADAGVRAAHLAAAGADADPAAMDQWLALVGGQPASFADGPVVPGGLALKRYPCCYALQRPIAATEAALAGRRPHASQIREVTVRVAEDALRPLIHSRPGNGLQAKFSLEYAVAATILDRSPSLDSFSDEAVARGDAQDLLRRVRADSSAGGGGLLAGELEVEIEFTDGTSAQAGLAWPPGAPERPLTAGELQTKVVDCAGPERAEHILSASWDTADESARHALGGR